MGATSIHVQAVKPGSEIHNFREKELDYVRPELSHLNESWVGDSISHRLESAKQRYLDTVGQKMQAKAAPIREGVIVINKKPPCRNSSSLPRSAKNVSVSKHFKSIYTRTKDT